MVSHDLRCSTVTKQIAFDQRDQQIAFDSFIRARDGSTLLSPGFQIGNLRSITLT